MVTNAVSNQSERRGVGSACVGILLGHGWGVMVWNGGGRSAAPMKDSLVLRLKLNGLMSRNFRVDLNLVLSLDSIQDLLLPSSSRLRRQQFALRLKPVLGPWVVLVEANCSSISRVIALILWCCFPQNNLRKCGGEVWSFPKEARCLCLGFPTKVNAHFIFFLTF